MPVLYNFVPNYYFLFFRSVSFSLSLVHSINSYALPFSLFSPFSLILSHICLNNLPFFSSYFNLAFTLHIFSCIYLTFPSFPLPLKHSSIFLPSYILLSTKFSVSQKALTLAQFSPAHSFLPPFPPHTLPFA